MSSCTRTSTSVRSSPPRALYFCVRLYSANPQRLPTVCWCSPPRALYFCVLQCGASPKAFVRCKPTKASCFGVLYELQAFCAVRAYTGFIQCAPGFVLLCTVRAQRALRGASLQRVCASVYCTSPTSFVRCEPTKNVYSVRKGLCFCVPYEPHELCAVRAYKSFIQCAGARPPRLCTECLCARAVE